MSLKIVKEQIENFLASETPEVLCIRGAWGVGKTFAWNKYIKDAKDKKRIALNQYSYVSLFGINSLDSLKFAIYEHSIDKDLIGKEPSNVKLNFEAEKTLTSLFRKSIKFARFIPYTKDFSPALEAITFSSLNKLIICIDDFERSGNGLTTKEVLGLINSLKEQKKCKVVLILNDEAFEKEMESEFKLFREKVIDIELHFNPSPEDCAEISLPKGDENFKKLAAYTSNLGINNIRIIKKIERLSIKMIDLLSDFEQETIFQALQSLTLFTWCFYTKGDNIPEIDYIKNYNYLSALYTDKLYPDKKDEKNEKEILWDSILNKYKYSEIDEFDLVILKSVETGYINEEDFIREANIINQKFVEGKSMDLFDKAWNFFNNSFEDNEKFVLDNMYESVKQNLKYIGLNNFDSTINFLREFGRNDEADELLEMYIENNKDNKGFFNINRYPYFNDLKDKKLVQKFHELKIKNIETRTTQQVLQKIVSQNGWSGEDEDILSQTSVDEYYEIFKSENGPHLSLWIYRCLEFGRARNASDKQKKITENAEKALKIIAKGNPLNARRVSQYGIKVNDTNDSKS